MQLAGRGQPSGGGGAGRGVGGAREVAKGGQGGRGKSTQEWRKRESKQKQRGGGNLLTTQGLVGTKCTFQWDIYVYIYIRKRSIRT
jgi:hypothetical protein